VLHSAPMRRTTGIGLAALAVACGGLFAGCGGGDDNGTDTAAGRAAQQYVDAYNARDFNKVCSLLSKSYKAERELVPGSADEPDEEGELETGCAEYFKEHTGGATTTLTLVDVQNRGSVASAHVRSESSDTPGGEADETIGLARQRDGSWKVTDITAYSGSASS
jgi:ketosteroid isomerase-like protein